MDIVAPLLVLAAALVLAVWRDPRTVRCGVLLLTLVMLLALLAFGSFLERAASLLPDVQVDAWLLLAAMVVLTLAVLTLGVFLVLTGVQVIRREGRSLAHALALVVGLLILAYPALGALSIAAGSSRLMAVLLLLALPAGWCGYGLMAYLLWSWVYGRSAARLGRQVGAVIVLGAGLVGGTRVGPLLASRVDRGIQWAGRPAQRGRPAPLVLSGGRGPDEERAEADAMADYARDHGADPKRILVERESTTTRENLERTRRLLDERGITGRVAVVTSSFHAFRAATLMRAAGLDGYAVGAPTAHYYWPTAVLREYVAIMRDHARLNVAGLVASSFPLGMWVLLSFFS